MATKVSWPVTGHKNQVEILQRSIESGKLAGSYLLYGPRGLGKKYLVNLVCRVIRNIPFENPDTFEQSDIFRLPQNGSRNIPVDDVRNALRFLSLKQNDEGKKFLIVDRAEAMTIEAANALLKRLEEPAANTHIFLIAEKIDKVPATIRSRCQLLKLNPLTKAEMQSWIVDLKLNNADEATLLKIAMGRPGRAKLLNEDNLEGYKNRLKKLLDMLRQSTNDNFTTFNSWLEEKKKSSEAVKSSDTAEDSLIDLEYLELLLRDILIVRIGQSDIFNVLAEDSIIKLAREFTVAELKALIDSIADLRKQLETAANVQLVWENFLLQIPIKK